MIMETISSWVHAVVGQVTTLLPPFRIEIRSVNCKRLFYPLLKDIGRFVWVCRC